MTTMYVEAPAAALGKDIPANYSVTVNGHTVRTSGTVQSVRRVGEFKIEITLKHRKTGEIHVNVLDARTTVHVFATFLQPGYAEEMARQPMAAAIGGLETAQMWVEGQTGKLKATLKNNMWNFAGLPVER